MRNHSLLRSLNFGLESTYMCKLVLCWWTIIHFMSNLHVSTFSSPSPYHRFFQLFRRQRPPLGFQNVRRHSCLRCHKERFTKPLMYIEIMVHSRQSIYQACFWFEWFFPQKILLDKTMRSTFSPKLTRLSAYNTCQTQIMWRIWLKIRL